MQNINQVQSTATNTNTLPANNQGLKLVESPPLPKDVSFTNYELPQMQNIKPVEKPNFQQYFNQNIKPMFTDLMNSQIQQNQKLIGDYANQYQQTIKPLTDQVASSIYGRNVGATSGLGQAAYAKGISEIMRPVTEYGLQLQGNTIGNINNQMTNLATTGIQQDLNQQLNEYNLNQDRLFQQGQQTYQDTLANKKYAADMANQFALSKYGVQTDFSKMSYETDLQKSMAQYQNALQQGDMNLANQLQQQTMVKQQELNAKNATLQNELQKQMADYQNALQRGDMALANQLQQDNMKLQDSYTVKNMSLQTDLQKSMADYQNALQQGNMTLANTLQKDVMDKQQVLNVQNSIMQNLLGKDMASYQTALQQGNMKLAATIEQSANDRKQIMDLALSGKLGDAGSDIIANQLGLSPEIANALKSSGRKEILDSYWNTQMANNLPIDDRVLNSLAVVNGGGPLTENEKKKYLSSETNLPPSDAFRRLIDNADKSKLANFGFTYDVKSRPIQGSWIGEREAYWDMDSPQNVNKFNDLYKNNKEFRDWVSTQI